MTVTIQRVRPDQLELLQQLARQTYAETFGAHTDPEDLQAYFEEAYGLERLQGELDDPESRSFIIFRDGRAAGYLKLNWGQAQTEQELDKGFEVQRIYILREFQGLGLGRQLFDHALAEAEQSDCDWIWLGVWEKNYKAQAFYRNYGFEKFSEHAFPVGEQVDVDWLLKKSLHKHPG